MRRGVQYIICMVVALFALSCDKSVDVVESYVDVDISTAIEGRYFDDDYSRAGDDEFEVDDSKYDMRYTIELWSGDCTTVIYRYETTVEDIADNLEHSFRVVAGAYKLVIFADYIADDNKTSHYDTTKGLDEITILATEGAYRYAANDSSRDCYGYSAAIDVTSSFSLSDITLKRPMAKMTLANSETSTVAADAAISISYGTYLPYGYDLVRGKVIQDETVEVSVSYASTSESEQTDFAFDYIFVSDPVNYLMTFNVGEKTVSGAINFEQNKTTNITANFNINNITE